MTDIAVFQRNLENLSKNVRTKISIVLYEKAKLLLEDFQKRSAVDTGLYRSQWRFIKPRTSGDVIQIVLRNSVGYAGVLFTGAPKFGSPWWFPKRGKGGRFNKGTGKLFVKDGRVWAGGLSPGKDVAAGGVAAGLVSDKRFLKQMMSDLADVIAKGI